MDPEALLQQAIQTARQGKRAEARQILSQVVKIDPQNLSAWYLLAQVVDQSEQATYCLKKVLEIDPKHSKALQKLADLQGGAPLAEVQNPPPPAPGANMPRPPAQPGPVKPAGK